MPVRATKRGAERTPFASRRLFDVLICGASFAGLAVARELRADAAPACSSSTATRSASGRPPRAPRRRSGCANLGPRGLDPADLRLAGRPHAVARAPAGRCRGRSRRSTTGTLCALLWEQCGGGRVRDRQGRPGGPGASSTPTAATCRAPLIVDALGWRRVLGAGRRTCSRPRRRSSRGLEVHPGGRGRRSGAVDRPALRLPPATAGRSRPATRCAIGVGSFDPHDHVKEPTLRLADGRRAPSAVRYQGNWIPHRLRPAAEDGVFFVGDSAGHCLPLTAEGIRTALYFGIACGRELRAGRRGPPSTARRRCAATRAFSASHRVEVRVRCSPAQQSVRACTGGRWTRLVGCSPAAGCPTGPSATTSRSRRRRFALPAPLAPSADIAAAA